MSRITKQEPPNVYINKGMTYGKLILQQIYYDYTIVYMCKYRNELHEKKCSVVIQFSQQELNTKTTETCNLDPVLLFLELQKEYESEGVCLLLNPSWHLLVILSQQYKHQKKRVKLCHLRRTDVFIVNFEHWSHIFLVFLLLTLNEQVFAVIIFYVSYRQSYLVILLSAVSSRLSVDTLLII